jgi:hypothetical protein
MLYNEMKSGHFGVAPFGKSFTQNFEVKANFTRERHMNHSLLQQILVQRNVLKCH